MINSSLDNILNEALYLTNLKAIEKADNKSEIYFIVEKIAYNNHLKNQERNSNENWHIAQKQFAKWCYDNRKSLIKLWDKDKFHEFLDRKAFEVYPQSNSYEENWSRAIDNITKYASMIQVNGK